MNFANWLRLQEKTLYHGTVVDNEASIRKYGIQGGWHDPNDTFVGSAYDGDYEASGVDRTEDDDIIFMADKETVDKAVNAMVFHIGRKLGKDFHDVTDNDIRNHGLLVIMKDMEDDPYDPDDRRWAYEDPPRGLETGDYWDTNVGGDIFLKGASLLRYLKRLGAWPRDWGPDNSERQKLDRGYLGRVAVQRVQDQPKQDVIDAVRNSDIKDVRNQMSRWKL